MTSLEGNKIKIIFSVMLSGRGGGVIWEKGKRGRMEFTVSHTTEDNNA